MRTKEEYEAMVKFQEKFTPEMIEAKIKEAWSKMPKTRLEVNEWKEEREGKEIYCFFCTIVNPKIGKERALSVGTGIGGIKNFLKMMHRDFFILGHEVIANGKPYDAGEFWDKIMEEDES